MVSTTAVCAIQPELNDSTTAADGGQIHLVESGFQATQIPPDSYATGRVLVAVVLDNTSKHQQAQSVALTIKLFDAEGRSLFDPDGSPNPARKIDVLVLPPGGRSAFAQLFGTMDEVAKHRTPVRTEVKVGGADWRVPNDKPEITVKDVKVVQHPDGSADIHYTAEVPDLKGYTNAQNPLVHVLFRDSSGKLLGGMGPFIGVTPLWTAGTSSREVDFSARDWQYDTPAGADLSRTEVYGFVG